MVIMCVNSVHWLRQTTGQGSDLSNSQVLSVVLNLADSLTQSISQLPKLCVKISILRHRRMWVRSFSTRLTSVTFAEDKVLIFLILCKNAKIVQL